jgi:tRNA (cytidine/uridine-2'-O-)-methyltransferase
MALNIVLISPDIPQNTGNIARTCVVTDAKLHLVKPLGFKIDDKHLKRAGLDYWSELDITIYENVDEFFEIHGDKKLYFFTTKGSKNYCDVQYNDGDFLVFGRETKGIDEQILKANYENALRIPMKKKIRSLNLSNSVAIALYEALRQLDFQELSDEGKLTIK